MDYKIIFPTGFYTENKLNDNIDINVILKNGSVYWGTIFTIQNVEYLMTKDNKSFFWSLNMVIVDELTHKDINDLIYNIVDSGVIEQVFSNIGNIEEQVPGLTFQDITHMGDFLDI